MGAATLPPHTFGCAPEAAFRAVAPGLQEVSARDVLARRRGQPRRDTVCHPASQVVFMARSFASLSEAKRLRSGPYERRVIAEEMA